MKVQTSLHVETTGEGPAIALLHGWGLNLRVWDGLRASLASRHRVITIDLPGHGRSGFDPARASIGEQADDILAVLPEHCSLLGWSLGGQLAMQMAARAPERIAQLMLVATTPRFERAPDWPAGLDHAVLDGFAAHLDRDYRGTVADFLELQVRGSQDAAGVLATLRASLFAHGEGTPAALAAGFAILRGVDLRPLLSRLTARTLVIAGQYDRVTPAAAGRAIADAIDDAQFTEMRRAGHAPFLSHAEAFAERLATFLGAHAVQDDRLMRANVDE